MKRRETPLLVICGVMFLAMAVRLGLAAHQAAAAPAPTVTAAPAVWEESVLLDGVFIREETLLRTDSPCYMLTAREGRRAAAGSVLGCGGRDGASLARAGALLRLRSGSPDTARARGDTALLRAMEDGFPEEQGLPEGTELLRAPCSGLFSARWDGWEYLSPEKLKGDLTAAAISDMLLAEPEPSDGVWGRMVTGNRWYFAAELPPESAPLLREGMTVLLDPEESGGDPARAEVMALCRDDKGKVYTVLSCCGDPGQVLYRRFARLRAVTGRLEGLQLPAEALRPEGEDFYAECAVGSLTERVRVTVLKEKKETVLIAPGDIAPGSGIRIIGSDQNLFPTEKDGG